MDHAFDTWCRPQLQLNALCVCVACSIKCVDLTTEAHCMDVWGNYNTVLYIHIVCTLYLVSTLSASVCQKL